MATPAGNPLDSETREMIRLLQAAADRARKLMLNPPGKTDKSKAFNASRAAQLLAGVNRELDAVGGKMVAVTSKKVAAAFKQGIADGDQLARDAGIRPDGSALQGGFNVVDRRRAAILVKQTQQANEDLSKAVKSIKDTTGKVVRQTQALGLDSAAVNRMLAGGTIEGVPRSTLRDLKAMVQKAAIDGKIVTVNNRTGAKMSFKPAYYAELVYQTKLAETTNIATVQRLRERKIQYVKIIGSNSRRFCTAFVGRAFYIGDGADPRFGFPHIRELHRGGPPFHPRCTKRYTAFVPGLQSPEQIEAAKLKPNERELLGKPAGDAQRTFESQERKTKASEPSFPPAIQEAAVRWSDSLTGGEREAVRRYQSVGWGYAAVNSTLRGRPAMRSFSAVWVEEVIAGLDSAIAKGAVPHPVTAYRAMRGTNDLMRSIEAAAADRLPFIDPGFCSVTLSSEERSFAEFWGKSSRRVLMKVEIPAGTPAAFPAAATGELGGQLELVLQKSSSFEILGIEEVEGVTHVKVRLINE